MLKKPLTEDEAFQVASRAVELMDSSALPLNRDPVLPDFLDRDPILVVADLYSVQSSEAKIAPHKHRDESSPQQQDLDDVETIAVMVQPQDAPDQSNPQGTEFDGRWTLETLYGDAEVEDELKPPALLACLMRADLDDDGKNEGAAEMLIADGADPMARDAAGRTSLHIAAFKGANRALKHLLGICSAQVDERDASGWTPLMYAVDADNVDTVRILLDHGVEVTARDGRGWNVLHLAASQGRCELIDEVHKKYPAGEIDSQDTDGKSALMIAAENGHLESLELLRGYGADPGVLDNEGRTALHLAATSSHTHVVHSLLQAGADSSIADKTGNTALHLAAMKGQVDIVTDILRSPAAADLLNAKGGMWDRTPLAYAVEKTHSDTVRVLLQAGADPGITSENGNTAIHLAAAIGQVDIMKDILRLHSNANLLNAKGGTSQATALTYAVDKSHVDISRVLLRAGADPSIVDMNGNSALHIAAARGEVNIVKDILELSSGKNLLNARGGSWQGTPLACAVDESQTDVVHLLLDAGADPTILTGKGSSALHLAAILGQVDVVKEILRFHSIEDLLNARGGPSQVTPLAYAVSQSHADAVHLLLEAGADPSITNGDGDSALHQAATAGQVEIVRDILRFHSNEDLLNAKGGSSEATPLAYAVGKSHVDVVHLLLEAGADPSIANGEGDSALHIAAVVGQVDIVKDILTFHSSEDILNAKGGSSQATPLVYAADRSHADVVHLLLEADADPTIFENDGDNALHIAAMTGQVDIVKDILRLHSSKDLLNARGGKSRATALAYAINGSHVNIAQMLLDAGADPCIPTNTGDSALHLAAGRGLVNIVRSILRLPGIQDLLKARGGSSGRNSAGLRSEEIRGRGGGGVAGRWS